MLQKFIAYLSKNRRLVRMYIRTNYTRPLKDWTHIQELSIRHFLLVCQQIINRKNNFRFFGLMFIFFFLFRDFAFAAEVKGTEALNNIIEVLNALIAVISLIAQPMVMLAGWLLSPDWTFGDIIELRPILHQMWIYIANIVYIFFAFALIGIAIMNIFHENANYSIQKSLPKLIMGILIVPFTWFIVSGTLTISNILTASVIQLPFDTIKSTGKDSILDKTTIPKTIVINITGASGSALVSTGSSETITLREFLDSQNGAYNILPFYAYGIFKIDKIQDISPNQAETTVKQVVDIVKKLFAGTLFALIFCILIIAITFVLFSRMALLWLYAIFSPLFAIGFFFGWKVDKFKSMGKFADIKMFVSLAMVPVLVSAALSFGLMFLSLTSNLQTGTTKSYSNITKCTDNNDCQNIAQGNFNLKIIGNFGNSADIAGGVVDVASGFISYIIMNALALGILWMAVMAALSSSKITEAAVKPFSEAGDAVGKFIQNSPKYAPIPGLPKGMKGQSFESMSKGIQYVANAPGSSASSKGNLFGQSLLGGDPKLTEAGNELITALNNSTDKSTKLIADKAKSILDATGGDPNKMLENSVIMNGLRQFQTKSETFEDINPLLKKQIKALNLNNANDIAKLIGFMDEHFEQQPNMGDILPGKKRDQKISSVNDLKSYYGSSKVGETSSANETGILGKVDHTGLSSDSKIQTLKIDNGTGNTVINVNNTTQKLEGNGKDEILSYLKTYVKSGNEVDLKKWLKDEIKINDSEITDIITKLGKEFFKKETH
ncbi:MAG: hypothetical protein PHZ26_02145 [Candidatus Gracilibacteria bacterium]|nr:hypothetical protein [Candidatus Gracilibacteria bacterium]MDD2908536.1 hypothetical protein [Candidatus Gracilibacteria bacterium]